MWTKKDHQAVQPKVRGGGAEGTGQNCVLPVLLTPVSSFFLSNYPPQLRTGTDVVALFGIGGTGFLSSCFDIPLCLAQQPTQDKMLHANEVQACCVCMILSKVRHAGLGAAAAAGTGGAGGGKKGKHKPGAPQSTTTTPAAPGSKKARLSYETPAGEWGACKTVWI